MPTREQLSEPETADVELTVPNPYIVPATAKTEEERERAWRELLESWNAHPLREDAPRLTRDQRHERR